MKKMTLVGSLLGLSMIAVLASVRQHGVWERELATRLMWSTKEAYFFAARQREGWSGNLLELAWEGARAYAGLAGNRTDRKRWLEITRMTASSVRTIRFPDTDAFPAGVFEDQIYLSEGGTLVKFVDDKLVQVSADEQTRFHRDRQGSGEFRDIEGWSVEINVVRGSPGESNYPMLLAGVPVNLLVMQLPDRKTATVRQGGEMITVLDLEANPVRLDLASYRRSFEAGAPRDIVSR